MRQTLLIILFLICGICANAQRTFIVIAGINDYIEPSVNDLRCCEADADSYYALMSKKKDAVIHIFKGRNATKQNILSTLQAVCRQAGSNDAVVFFFSGHGYPGGFCPVDMRSKATGLSYAEMQTAFKQCKARRKMVFADACFSGGLRKDKSSAVNEARNGDVMFFLSSRTNETSQEIPGGRNGQFTRFLIRGLGGGADADRNRTITAKELYNFVHQGVAYATAEKQHPVMWGNFNNTMPIVVWQK
ncbi:MAG: caspase family protein [Bacteroidaceae bacterium]|nr:caspase family protein [Bacteroidaceae bacterium]